MHFPLLSTIIVHISFIRQLGMAVYIKSQVKSEYFLTVSGKSPITGMFTQQVSCLSAAGRLTAEGIWQTKRGKNSLCVGLPQQESSSGCTLRFIDLFWFLRLRKCQLKTAPQILALLRKPKRMRTKKKQLDGSQKR